MQQMIFVNLPVSNIEASRRYFTQLGYSFNEAFCDANALCLVISDTIFAMLLHRDFFQTFTPRKVADAHTSSEVLICLSAASREAVDTLVDKAKQIGAHEVREPMVQGEFMYARSIADLDGHIWEILWMDPEVAKNGCAAQSETAARA